MAAHAGNYGIADELQRVGRTGILRKGSIVQIEPSRCRIDDNVLQHSSKSLRAGVDLGFSFGREADNLGVATSFEVENAVIAPTVLVVSNQPTLRIRRKGCLACTRESKEQSH